MGVFDIFKKKPEEPQQEIPYMMPMPTMRMASPTDQKTIVYMTENEGIPPTTESRNWGFNVQHMSFTNLKNDGDRFRLKRNFESEIMMRENFSPRFRSFKTGFNQRVEDRMYSHIVDLTLSKAISGDFQKTVTAATNVIETKTQSGPIVEEKKKGGILSSLFG